MNQASGQPAESDATLISGDSVVGEVVGMGRLAPGKTFAGRHLLLARLGVGGAGIIYAAYDSKLDRKVALELLRPRLNDAVVDATRRVAAISHPNILTVFEVGTVHDIVFVITELVDGGSLREWIDAGPHPWPVVLGLFRQLAAGLAAAHRAGLIHGALAPEHVLLTRDLDPRIADFGLADTVSADSVPAPRTPSDRRGGAWAYLAPERFADGPADPLADQFGLCVAFYEALYSDRPFEGRTLQALQLAITEGRIREPPARSKVPIWLRRIVVRGLANDPELRWPTIDALIDGIDRESSNRRQRPMTGVALGVAIVAGGLASARPDPTSTASAASPICELRAAEDAFAQTWSPERRAAFEQQLGQVEPLWSKSVTASSLLRIDAWSADWHSEWLDACAATRIRAEQSEATLDRRLHCLERQRRRVAAYIDAIMRSRPEQRVDVLQDLDALDRVEDCRVAPPPVPDDLARRERIDALEAALDQIRALQLAGREDTASKLHDLSEAVRVSDWVPLIAEHQLLRARAQLELDRRHELPRHLFSPHTPSSLSPALGQAIAGGDDRLAVEIALELARLAEWDDRPADALPWLDLAGGLIARAGRPPELLGEYWLALARVLRLSGDSRAAQSTAEKARNALAELCDEDSPLLAEAELELALAAFAAHDFAVADEALASARDRWLRLGGDHHPNTLAVRSTAARFALARGRLRDAERLFGELASRYRWAGEAELAAEHQIGRATAQHRQGAHLLARASLNEAVSLLDDWQLHQPSQSVEALAALAMHEAERGELDRALEHAEQALDWSEYPDARPSDRAAALHARARVQLLRGDFDAAAADLELVPIADRSPDFDYEDRYRVALTRGDLRAAAALLDDAASRFDSEIGDQFDPWHALQIALRQAQFCADHGQWARQSSVSTCDRTPAEHVEHAREQLASIQNPDPALASLLDRLQQELDL